DVGVPPPVLDPNTMGLGIPTDANDPMIAGALLRNQGKSTNEMLTERTEYLQRADALKRQAAAEELQRQRDFAAMPPATGALGKLVATAGYLAGGAATPESLVGAAGPEISLGENLAARLAGRFLGGAVVGAPTAAAVDPLVQRLRIDAGTRKSYD